MNKYFEMKYGF